MIKIVRANGRNCPTVFCDLCQEKIVGEGGGLVEWSFDIGEYRFAHKQCSPKMDQYFDGWMSLSEFFFYLIHNAKLDMKIGEHHHELLERIEL